MGIHGKIDVLRTLRPMKNNFFCWLNRMTGHCHSTGRGTGEIGVLRLFRRVGVTLLMHIKIDVLRMLSSKGFFLGD